MSSYIPEVTVQDQSEGSEEEGDENNCLLQVEDKYKLQSGYSAGSLLYPSDCAHSGSLPSQLNVLESRRHLWTHTRLQSNSLCSSTSDWISRNEWHSTDGHRRWSMATQKIKNLLAVSDAINSKSKQKRIEKTMSSEQKSIFLDKFSTRERKLSGQSFNPKKTAENNHLQEWSSNISSTELKELFADFPDSKANISNQNYGYHYTSRPYCEYLKLLFEPYSLFIYVWSWILITAIHYNAWVIIFRIAFPTAQHRYQIIWFVLDYTADFIYLIDIIVSAKMSFLENGIYVNSAKRVMFKYIKSKQFGLDLLCLIPLDILYIFIKIDPSLRLPRLIKFYKLFAGKRVLESMTNFPNLLRGVFWLHIMFLLMHYNSCFFFIISKYEGFGSNNWVYPKHEGAHAVLVHRYFKCMYWSTLVLTTIGESHQPETTIECLYMIVCYITGIFIFATIVGQAGNVIQNMNASRMEFERQRDNTMQYMKDHNVPSHLQKRVRLWYDYTYSRGRFNGGDDINEATMLPDKMKTELALHVHLETLRKVSFLQKCQPEFLHDLVLKMKLHIFTPGDFIVRKGEIAREMYVISDGVAEVVSETGHILKVLQPGDFFGEIGLLSLDAGQNRRTADVRSCGYIELFVLSKDDVMTSTRDYPDAQRILARHGRKRLALGSKAASGLRDETTSGSQSESEIELKVTRPESLCETYFNVCAERNEPNHISMDDIETPSNHVYVTSQRRLFTDKPQYSTLSIYPPSKPPRRSNTSSQRSLYLGSSMNNVIGPASSMKSLDCRLTCSNKNDVSSGDEHRMKNKGFLKPNKSNIRRSNSDMQRRPKRKSVLQNSARSVFSDGERNKNDTINDFRTLSFREQYEHNEYKKSTVNTDDFATRNKNIEDNFLDSMKELYLDTIQSVKRKKKTELKALRRKMSELEKQSTERQYEKDQIIKQQEEKMKMQLYAKEEELYRKNNELKRKEEEHRTNEAMWRRRVENLESELNENNRFYRNGGPTILRSKSASLHVESSHEYRVSKF